MLLLHTYLQGSIPALLLPDFTQLCPVDVSALGDKWPLSDPFLGADAGEWGSGRKESSEVPGSLSGWEARL